MFKKLLTPSFIQELDDKFYAQYPEEWEKAELFLDIPIFYSIWKRDADSYIRPRQENEQATSEYILRAGRKVWEVGRVFAVRTDIKTEVKNETTQNNEGVLTDTYTLESKGTVVGYIKLIAIKPGQKEDKLIFEKVDAPS